MAKPKKPLLSLGARGTIADSLTFQKRRRGTIARQKPIPTDPKTLLQLAQRQRYKDAVAVWNALTIEEKEAWRGVCPGLTAYQCFMSSELKYVPPPPLPIDIGAAAVDRANTLTTRTFILKDNPANASGLITSVELYVGSLTLNDCQVAIFYEVAPNTFTTRSHTALGDLDAGYSKHDVSLEVQEGDYIGLFFTGGLIDQDPTGYAGLWYSGVGVDLIPCADQAFSFLANRVISLYGIGETD